MFAKKIQEATPEVKQVPQDNNVQDELLRLRQEVDKLKPAEQTVSLCSFCGIRYIRIPNGATTTIKGQLACGWCVGQSTADIVDEKAILDSACSRLLGRTTTLIGCGDLIQPHYQVHPDCQGHSRRWSHENQIAVAAAFDARFGRQLSGPRLAMVQKHVGVERQAGGVFVNKYWPVPVGDHTHSNNCEDGRCESQFTFVGADEPTTYSRGPRPELPSERADREFDDAIRLTEERWRKEELRLARKQAQLKQLQAEVDSLS